MIDLKIVKKIDEVLPPCNVFEATVEVMHGDGDKYEHISFKGGYDEVLPKIKLLVAVLDLDWNSRCDDDCVEDAVTNTAVENGQNPSEALDWYSDHIGRDCTNHGNSYAMPQSIEIFWYDESRQKFEVDVVRTKAA